MESVPKQLASEMDPKRKDAQGLDYWAAGLLNNGLIGRKEYDNFVYQNSNKEKVMEERKLPQLAHYGTFESVTEMRERLSTLPEEARFIARCVSKIGGEVRRLLDTDLDGACQFVSELPGGFEAWTVEVKEFVETIAAGTIIVSPAGRVDIETWKGAHYLNTTNSPKYRASFDPEAFSLSYAWSIPEDAGNEETKFIQEYALRALRHQFPYLRPKPNESVYLEYGVKKSGEIYFIEANDSTLLTGK